MYLRFICRGVKPHYLASHCVLFLHSVFLNQVPGDSETERGFVLLKPQACRTKFILSAIPEIQQSTTGKEVPASRPADHLSKAQTGGAG